MTSNRPSDVTREDVIGDLRSAGYDRSAALRAILAIEAEAVASLAAQLAERDSQIAALVEALTSVRGSGAWHTRLDEEDDFDIDACWHCGAIAPSDMPLPSRQHTSDCAWVLAQTILSDLSTAAKEYRDRIASAAVEAALSVERKRLHGALDRTYRQRHGHPTDEPTIDYCQSAGAEYETLRAALLEPPTGDEVTG